MKLAILLLAVLLLTSRPSEATSCAGVPGIVAAARDASAIVVATVAKVPSSVKITRHPDGSTSAIGVIGDQPVELTVDETLRGPFGGRLTVSTSYRFVEGKRYLVYGAASGGVLNVSACGRVVAEADAAEDLKYLRARESGSELGVMLGQVTRRRVDGVVEAPKDLFTVVAKSASGRYEVSTKPYGWYEIAIPPGSYLIWVEQAGRQLTDPEAIEVRSGAESFLNRLASQH